MHKILFVALLPLVTTISCGLQNVSTRSVDVEELPAPVKKYFGSYDVVQNLACKVDDKNKSGLREYFRGISSGRLLEERLTWINDLDPAYATCGSYVWFPQGDISYKKAVMIGEINGKIGYKVIVERLHSYEYGSCFSNWNSIIRDQNVTNYTQADFDRACTEDIAGTDGIVVVHFTSLEEYLFQLEDIGREYRIVHVESLPLASSVNVERL